MAKTPTKFDKRLIGTWQSDRRKTFQHYKPDKSISAAHLRRFKALFGKFVIRWGRTKCYSELDGWEDSGDDSSVVIRHPHSIAKQNVLKQIHFEGDCYWFALDGSMNEWFRRIHETPKRSQSQS
ncbi:MAG TPA: hypothetical protein VGM98_08550 [Schlesneria sp.]|jgi:hypothetical protein